MAKKSSKKVASKKTPARAKRKRQRVMSGAKPKRAAKASAKEEYVGRCFVLMPFKEPFSTYYKTIIRPAVLSQNLEVLRGDSLFTPTPIMGDVWQMIQDARVLIADLTEKNPNVFYELGLGHAIGKSIILVAETMDDVPFDLQQLRVLIYDKDDPAWGNKLKNNISNAIKETLEKPVEAVPPMFRKRVKSQAPVDSEVSVRLAALERRIAAGERGTLRVRGQWDFDRMSVAELRGFGLWESQEEAVAWARVLLEHGFKRREVRELMKKAGMSLREIDPVTDLAGF